MTIRRFHRCPVCNSATTSSQWCDVAGGLPDDDITVLVALSDGEVWPAYYGRAYDGSDEGWLYVTGDPIESARVLYWMPMPPHPDAPQEPAIDDRDHWEEMQMKDRS